MSYLIVHLQSEIDSNNKLKFYSGLTIDLICKEDAGNKAQMSSVCGAGYNGWQLVAKHKIGYSTHRGLVWRFQLLIADFLKTSSVSSI